MAPKKRNRREVVDEEEKKGDEEEVEVEEDALSPKKQKKTKTPTTLKEKILAIVKNSDTLIGSQKIKKLLISEYGYTGDKAFTTNVNKALKALVEANSDNFGKIGGSYHGGITSRAYLAHEEAEQEKLSIKNHEINGDILCPYCSSWCSDGCFIREDSVARGGLHECEFCSKRFWSWISDGYLYGHREEYRYGDGAADYAEINKKKRRT